MVIVSVCISMISIYAKVLATRWNFCKLSRQETRLLQINPKVLITIGCSMQVLFNKSCFMLFRLRLLSVWMCVLLEIQDVAWIKWFIVMCKIRERILDTFSSFLNFKCWCHFFLNQSRFQNSHVWLYLL